MPNAQGCDVSHNNGSIDWDAVTASGVSFVGIKASQGSSWRDPMLSANLAARRARPGLVGAILYHYPSGGDAAQEAANFLGAIGQLRDDERLALDIEQGPTGHGAPSFEWIQEFIAELPQDRNRCPIVYTAAHVWNEIGNPAWPDATTGKVHLWAKQYAGALDKIASPWSFAHFWQKSESGTVRGISGAVDLDEFCLGDIDELRRYFALAAPVM